jgi:hypothetical protein
MNQGGSGGLSATDVLKLLYGDLTGGAAPTTDGIGLVLHDGFFSTESV